MNRMPLSGIAGDARGALMKPQLATKQLSGVHSVGTQHGHVDGLT